jgi:regulator of RNase E activity RraA
MTLLSVLAQYSTAEVSDALDACGITGALQNIRPLTPDTRIVGPAFTVKYVPYETKPATFKGAADYIDNVPEQSVLVIDNEGRNDCTTWGEILTRVALKRNIQGTLVNGAVRDVGFIKEQKYPVFCSSVYMRSGKNRVYMKSTQGALCIHGVTIFPGDIIFGDQNGVLSIPLTRLEEVLSKVRNIRKNEDAIINAVESGMNLSDARIKFHYDTPWEE